LGGYAEASLRWVLLFLSLLDLGRKEVLELDCLPSNGSSASEEGWFGETMSSFEVLPEQTAGFSVSGQLQSAAAQVPQTRFSQP
jgi:hypothetical protein